jgi:hypothetical protein
MLARLTAADLPPIAALRAPADREMRLLLACGRASLTSDEAAQVRALAASGPDWDRTLRLAARHHLRPLLHRHLIRHAAAEVPAAVIATLRDYAQKNGAFGLLFTGELLRILAALEAAGVDAMPFKGPALAQQVYGHVALRQFCDLDILVRETDVWTASAVLEAHGFTADAPIPEHRRAACLKQDYVRLFRRDGGRTIVELHWAVAPRAFAVRFDAAAVWRRATSIALQGRTVPAPGPEDLLLMLCVHGARHCWDTLEQLAAVAALLRSAPLDWRAVWQRADAMHCRRMVAFGVLLAHALFDAPLPPEAAAAWRSAPLRALASAIVAGHRSEDPEAITYGRLVARHLRLAARHLRLKDTYADRARAMAGELTVTTPADWALVDLPRPLSVAYPLVRAVRFARKHRVARQPALGDPS